MNNLNENIGEQKSSRQCYIKMTKEKRERQRISSGSRLPRAREQINRTGIFGMLLVLCILSISTPEGFCFQSSVYSGSVLSSVKVSTSGLWMINARQRREDEIKRKVSTKNIK